MVKLNKIKNTLKIINRIKDILLMFICLNLCPTITYKFSTRKLLPKPNQKHKFNKDEIFRTKILSNNKKEMKHFDEVNLVAYGNSFDINNIKKFKKPTFLISFWSSLRVKKDGNLVTHFTSIDHRYNPNYENLEPYNKDNIYYVVARNDICDDLIKNNCNIIHFEEYRQLVSGNYIKADEFNSIQKQEIEKYNKYKKKISVDICLNFYKPQENKKEAIKYFAPCGSFLALLSCIIPFCKKINIYGWDFYLKKKAGDLNTFQIQKTLFNPKMDWQNGRSWFHFESALINYYFAYAISKEKNINLISNLGTIDKHTHLIKKIEKVLFN